MISVCNLVGKGRSDFSYKQEIGCPDCSKVLASFRQTQKIAWAATHKIGVAVVLPIVFPIADGAYLESRSFMQSAITTAWARKHVRDALKVVVLGATVNAMGKLRRFGRRT